MLTALRTTLRFLAWRSGRQGLIVTAILAALTWAIIFPRAALADCSSLNPIEASSCEFDAIQYGFYETGASILWGFNRILLVGAYQLDAIRSNTIEVAFAGAYNALLAVVGPAILPVGTIALILAMMAIIAVPITGSQSPFNVRQILIWLVGAPILLTYLGEGLLTVETMRMDLGNSIFQAASAADFGQATLGAPGASNDFGAVPMLYPNNLCDATLERHSGGSWSAGDRRIDELVAGFLFATTEDIHCPWKSPGASILPSGFYNREPPYAAIAGIRSMESTDRQTYVDGVKQALQRQLIGLLPSILALLYYLLNLIFSLSLVAIWAALPIGMVFGFFASDMGWFTSYVKKAAGILQASWVASFIVGLLLAALMRASLTGNGTVFVGVAGGSMFFMLYSLGGAVQAFQGALGAVTAALGSLGGMAATSMQTAQGMLAGGARLGAMALTGGAAGAAGVLKTGLTGAMALKNTGSMRYAAGAVIGQSRRASEVMYGAATLAGEDPMSNDLLAGMQLGQAAKSSFRAANGALKSAAPRVRQHHKERATRPKGMPAPPPVMPAPGATQTAPEPPPAAAEEAMTSEGASGEATPSERASQRPRPRPRNTGPSARRRAYRASAAGEARGRARSGAGSSSVNEAGRIHTVRRYRPSSSASSTAGSGNAPASGSGRTYRPSVATSPRANDTARNGNTPANSTGRAYRPSAASGPARKGRKVATAPAVPSFRQTGEDARAMFIQRAPAPATEPTTPQIPAQSPQPAPAPAQAPQKAQGRRRQRPGRAKAPEATPAPAATSTAPQAPAQAPQPALAPQGRRKYRERQVPPQAPAQMPEAAPTPSAAPTTPQTPAQAHEAAPAPATTPTAPEAPAQTPEADLKDDGSEWLGEWPS